MKKFILLAIMFAAGAALAQPGFDEAKDLWADRGNKTSLEKAIVVYEKAYQTEPSFQLAERLAYAYYFLADAFLEKDAKADNYYKGYEWGLISLKFNGEFKKLTEVDKKSMGDVVTVLGKDYAGGIFWTATCIGKWGKMQGILKTIKTSKQARKMVEHLYKLDKTYYYGGPGRWLGSYFAIAPGMFGGDMKKSKEMYDEALKIAPDYFATYVLMAENYAQKIKDRKMYDELLDKVISGSDAILPEVQIEQKVEQEKAKKLKEEKF
jgi:tetratricopeptide (TPR) repeat protein